jgi:hypothetical protein
MTALAAPLALRPVPWHRLVWVVWRRYRATLVAVTGVLALMSAYLLVTGHRIRSAYAAAESCTPAHSASCEFQWTTFHERYGSVALIGTVLLLLPGLVGAFAGAPLLARELETGTFRYAWTQGVGRMRWAVAIVLPGAAAFAALMTAFGFLVSWHDRPLVDAGIVQRLHPATFPVTGLVVAGWTLAGFALGVLAGLLWRRVLPALATAFAAWFGLAYLASNLRTHYQAPLTTSRLRLGSGDLTLDQWWAKGGVHVSDSQLNQVLQAIGVQVHTTQGGFAVNARGGGVDPLEYLRQHGYTQVTSYQPDSRFWTFQWIEIGWLVVLSVVLLGTAMWLLRRRPA